jgi:hypothetical protein
MRHPDWKRLLALHVRDTLQDAFVWHSNDCCTSVARMVDSYSDHGLLERFAHEYTTALGAQRFIARHGGIINAVSAIAADAGLSEVSPRLAAPGDLVIVQIDDGGITLPGVVWHLDVICQQAHGKVFLPIEAIKKAWKV